MATFGSPETHVAFSVFENKGVFALLLGSGLSRSAEIPTGWEITLNLVQRVAEAEGVQEQADWGQWYRERYGKEPDYSDLLEQLALTPAMRRSILHSYIEPDEEDREEGRKIPTAGHRAIAELVRDGFIRVIVTTNFDRLMENALREAGIEPTIVGSVDALKGAEPLAHSACYILKLHGDYKDARILNTEEELNGYAPEYDVLLDRILDEYGLIVCGWSGEWDHALRAAIMRAPSRRYPLFWATRSPLRGKGQELCDHRRGVQVPIADADKFFSGLVEQVKTLADSRRKNPADIELLVARAKRYLSKPESMIQLSDLIEEEVKRVVNTLEASNLLPHGTATPQEFQRRVAVYESAVEGLAKISGLVGRWGNAGHLEMVLEAIRSLVGYGETVNGGLVVFLEIRRYPAVLVYQAVALGLVKASQWGALRSLLMTNIDTGYDRIKPISEAVFPLNWKGSQRDRWNLLEGYGNRYVPLSDHLHDDVFTKWGAAFMASMSGFKTCFILSEILAAFVTLEGVTKAEMQARALEPETGNGRNLYYMPVGRGGYDTEFRNEVTSKFEDQTFLEDLAKAGFGHRDPEMVALLFQNYSKCSARMRFW